MSERTIKQFTETLMCLQYPHPVSIISFRTPNFELVASIICWMVQRLDPTIALHDKIGTEDDRVQFLNGVASELAIKMNLFVDTRNLYSADRRAVKELLKIANVLDEALNLANEESTSDEEFESKATLQAATKAKSLVNEVAEISTRIIGLLKNQRVDSEDRSIALRYLSSISGDNNLEHHHIESIFTHISNSTKAVLQRLDKQCKILISNQRGMEEKIRKKTIDLARTSKRLESLKHVRPAYMDEYEQLEKELQVEYERYVARLRNMDYLEGEVLSFKQSAVERQNKAERSMMRMQKKIRDEEIRMLNGGEDNERETTSARSDNSAPSSFNAMQSGERSDALDTIVVDVSRVEALSTTSTLKDNCTSSFKSDMLSSEPLSSGSQHSFEGSEMSSLLMQDGNDSDENF